jgi:uncharacterized membrane protein
MNFSSNNNFQKRIFPWIFSLALILVQVVKHYIVIVKISFVSAHKPSNNGTQEFILCVKMNYYTSILSMKWPSLLIRIGGLSRCGGNCSKILF